MERFYKDPHMLARMREGSLGAYVDAFAQQLSDERYARASGRYALRVVTQVEAASLLGVCDRAFRRYLLRYEADGLAGLVDRRLV